VLPRGVALPLVAALDVGAAGHGERWGCRRPVGGRGRGFTGSGAVEEEARRHDFRVYTLLRRVGLLHGPVQKPARDLAVGVSSGRWAWPIQLIVLRDESEEGQRGHFGWLRGRGGAAARAFLLFPAARQRIGLWWGRVCDLVCFGA
jgi:hypothetical protein